MNVEIKDNTAAFLVTVNGLIVAHFDTLGGAWGHIVWMYRIASQNFTVGKKRVPVVEWIEHMVAVGYLE
jgi:hypothetical protein